MSLGGGGNLLGYHISKWSIDTTYLAQFYFSNILYKEVINHFEFELELKHVFLGLLDLTPTYQQLVLGYFNQTIPIKSFPN